MTYEKDPFEELTRKFEELAQGCVNSGLDFIRNNPDLTYTFTTRVLDGQAPVTGFTRAKNDASKKLSEAIDNNTGINNAGLNVCLQEILCRAEEEMGYSVNISNTLLNRLGLSKQVITLEPSQHEIG